MGTIQSAFASYAAIEQALRQATKDNKPLTRSEVAALPEVVKHCTASQARERVKQLATSGYAKAVEFTDAEGKFAVGFLWKQGSRSTSFTDAGRLRTVRRRSPGKKDKGEKPEVKAATTDAAEIELDIAGTEIVVSGAAVRVNKLSTNKFRIVIT